MTRSKGPKVLLFEGDVRALFDYREDGHLVWKVNRGTNRTLGRLAGRLNSWGYLQVRLNKRRYHEHRLVWTWHYGENPQGDIDHIDGDKTNNRISNLRLATRPQNNQNARKRAGTSSKWKGVSWAKNMKKWHAYINIETGRIQLGHFSEEADAAQAYNFAAAQYFGPYAKFNEAPQW